MKRMMVISAALALAPLGCVANQGDASVRFLNALGLKANTDTGGCTADTAVGISSGTFDVSGGQNYLMALAVETNTNQQSITISGENFSGKGLSDITLNELVYSYESSNTSLSLPAEEEDRVPIYAVYRPGTDPQGSYLTLWAFGPKGLAAVNALPQSFTETTTVIVTIKARGKLSGGQTVESNEIPFPVTVYNTGFVPSTGACPAGATTKVMGACGAGQGAAICRK